MNKKGKIVTGILMILVIVVITSAVILLLVKSGVIEVEEKEEVSVLDMGFIPYVREGFLAVKDFKFCGYVDEGYGCLGEGEEFYLGEEVHFKFIVESSTYGGDIMLVENYRVKGPTGEVLLEVDEKNNFYFDVKSKERKELITFKDYFAVGMDLAEGEYSLELLIENPLLNKKTKLIEKFSLVEEEYD